MASMAKKHDPVHNLALFKDRPCLLLNGGADPLVPAGSNQKLVTALKDAGQYMVRPHQISEIK
jgi:fermentation-respiration switch protein FrsA (DUF1100 family)